MSEKAVTVSPAEAHRYGGDHHKLSLIDHLGERVERELAGDFLQRDAQYIARLLPVLDRALAYFDPVVEGFEHLPANGPFLIVANHSGGIYMPDYWAFLRHWCHERGAESPIYSLGFDFLFAVPGARTLARRLGAVPASPAHAAQLLEAGMPVLVYPGGDEDDYRPWTERHRVELRGRTGFVKLALREQVPIVPMVAHGSHESIVVLTRGEAVARRLGFDRLRINIFPVMLGPPWGIAPVQLPTLPLPAKVIVRVCEPLDWTAYGPDAANDEQLVRHCYEQTVGRMQSALDELVEAVPHPVLARLHTATGLDRFTRRVTR